MAKYEKKVLITITPYNRGLNFKEVYDETMTVGELKDLLKDYSNDAKICLDLADSYAYASILSGNFMLTITNEEGDI